jgi:Ca2+-binding RTX toxin-like protein
MRTVTGSAGRSAGRTVGRLAALPGLLAAALVASSAIFAISTAPAYADGYDQSGWHATSVWNEGATAHTTVIDCASMIIGNMSGGTSYDSSGWSYTPPMPALPITGIVAGMGAEVDLDGAHPRVGESFYVHIWGRSVGTPCGAEGFIPIFVLPSGLTLDTSQKVVCASDGVVMAANDPTCPQPGAAGAKFQSAQAETGSANSYKILCGYASGCLGEYAWPAAYGHGFEFGIPVKATTAFNAGKVSGGAWVIDADHNGLLALSASLNVFAATGATSEPPAELPVVGGGTPVQDPGTAYRVVYDMPSTEASPKYRLDPSITTTYGIISTAEAFTNHVPGAVVFARDTDRSALAGLTTSASAIDSCSAGVDQMVAGPIDNAGASFRSEFDWRNSGCGTNTGGFTAGTTYYWRYGYIPLPDGTASIASAKVTWGAVQSFVAPASGSLTCNGTGVTVSIGLGQQPTDGDDVVLGTPGNDAINGGLGNDTICGLGGDDTLMGGPGNDALRGGDGDDTLAPGAGADSALGEAGVDTLSYADLDVPYTVVQPRGGVTYAPGSSCSTGYLSVCGAAGLDVVGGGPNGAFPERFVGSRFDDTITLDTTGSTVFSGDGNDIVSGGAGSDTISPGAGDDTVIGGGGTDTLSYAEHSVAVRVSLAVSGPQNTLGAGTDTISGVANLIGSSGNDTLAGSAAANTIIGGPGADSLAGGAGNDAIDAQDGVRDTVACDDGADSVRADRLDTLAACETITLPPVVVAGKPTVTGASRVGTVLAAHPGSWTAGTTLAYQWLANGAAIPGANKARLVLTAAQAGKRVAVRVTGTRGGYDPNSATSKARLVSTGLIAKGRVKIAGAPKVGGQLAAKVSKWRPAPLTYRYQWYANGKTLKGATKSTLRLTPASAGKRISVTVTASKPGYRPATKTSATTKAVKR